MQCGHFYANTFAGLCIDINSGAAARDQDQGRFCAINILELFNTRQFQKTGKHGKICANVVATKELGQEQKPPLMQIMIVCVVPGIQHSSAVFVMMSALLTWLYSLLFATDREFVTVVILTSPFKLLFFLCSSRTSYFFCLT